MNKTVSGAFFHFWFWDIYQHFPLPHFLISAELWLQITYQDPAHLHLFNMIGIIMHLMNFHTFTVIIKCQHLSCFTPRSSCLYTVTCLPLINHYLNTDHWAKPLLESVGGKRANKQGAGVLLTRSGVSAPLTNDSSVPSCPGQSSDQEARTWRIVGDWVHVWVQLKSHKEQIASVDQNISRYKHCRHVNKTGTSLLGLLTLTVSLREIPQNESFVQKECNFVFLFIPLFPVL